jgi:peptide deformylase
MYSLELRLSLSCYGSQSFFKGIVDSGLGFHLQYDMALLEIRVYPDPVLRNVAEEISEVTDETLKLVADMVETMRSARGAGLAANQIGIPVRIIVLESEAEKGPAKEALVVCNPVVVSQEGEDVGEEGCLSFPKFYEFVKRSNKVHVKGETLKKEPFEIICEGHLARAFQHEIDHLNGILFVDHLSPVKKSLFKKKYLKSEK